MVKLLKTVIFYRNFIFSPGTINAVLFPDENPGLHPRQPNLLNIPPDDNIGSQRRYRTFKIIIEYQNITCFIGNFIRRYPKMTIILNHFPGNCDRTPFVVGGAELDRGNSLTGLQPVHQPNRP